MRKGSGCGRNLREGGVQARKTKQKDAIRVAFETADRPLSPEETLALAQQHVEGISIATIYRNIGSLVEEKWLTAIALPGEPARYEVAGKGVITSGAMCVPGSLRCRGAA